MKETNYVTLINAETLENVEVCVMGIASFLIHLGAEDRREAGSYTVEEFMEEINKHQTYCLIRDDSIVAMGGIVYDKELCRYDVWLLVTNNIYQYRKSLIRACKNALIRHISKDIAGGVFATTLYKNQQHRAFIKRFLGMGHIGSFNNMVTYFVKSGDLLKHLNKYK